MTVEPLGETSGFPFLGEGTRAQLQPCVVVLMALATGLPSCVVDSQVALLGWLQLLGESFPELSWTLHRQHSSAPGEALQLCVLPRTEMPLLGQLNLFQLYCGCTLRGSQLSPDQSRGITKEL